MGLKSGLMPGGRLAPGGTDPGNDGDTGIRRKKIDGLINYSFHFWAKVPSHIALYMYI